MDQSLEFGGIAPPSAAANYLILTGDFTGFEKAISDLLSIGMVSLTLILRSSLFLQDLLFLFYCFVI